MLWKSVPGNSLGVRTPRVVALKASVELCWGLVSTSRLQEPPTSLIVAALGALDFRSGKGVQPVLLVSDHFDWSRRCQFFFRCLGQSLPSLVGVATIVTGIRNGNVMLTFYLLEPQPCAALRAELQSGPPPSWSFTPS